MITWDKVKQLARQFQMDEFSTLREYFEVLFLQRLYGQKGSERVFFKGGTAIHLLFGSFRFSEDLDFTSSLSLKELHPLLMEAQKEMAFEVSGIELQKLEVKSKSATFRLRYQGEALKYPLTVRLEFSLREEPITREVSVIETPFPISPYPLVVHLHPEEILAEKVRAVIRRGKGRDLFDIWFLLSKGYKIKWDWVKKKMAIYRNTASLPERLTEKVEAFETKDLLRDLSPFLPVRYRPFIRELKERLLEKLRGI